MFFYFIFYVCHVFGRSPGGGGWQEVQRLSLGHLRSHIQYNPSGDSLEFSACLKAALLWWISQRHFCASFYFDRWGIVGYWFFFSSFSFHIFSAVLWSVIYLQTISVPEIISLEVLEDGFCHFIHCCFIRGRDLTDSSDWRLCSCSVFLPRASFCVFPQWWVIFLLTCIISYLTCCVHNTQLYNLFGFVFTY